MADEKDDKGMDTGSNQLMDELLPDENPRSDEGGEASYRTKELESELEEKRGKITDLEKIIKDVEDQLSEREAELARWHDRVLEETPLTQGDVDLVSKQKIKSLSYHLKKENSSRTQLEEELKTVRGKLDQQQQRIKELENKLVDKNSVIEDLKADLSERIQRISGLEDNLMLGRDDRASTDLADTEDVLAGDLEEISELDRALDTLVSKPEKPGGSLVKDSRELLDLLIKLGRVKVVDAAILMDTNMNRVKACAKILYSRGLIQVSGRDKNMMLIATKDLLERRKKVRRGRK